MSALVRSWVGLIAALVTASVAAEPAALRDLRLLDQQSRVIAPASFEGRALLLNFVFAGCSSTCPVQVRELAMLQRGLPPDVRSGLQLLSVTVDPVHDTPQALAAFARLHDANVPEWRFATGEVDQVDTLIRRMAAIDPRKLPRQPQDHRTSLWLFDSSGGLVQRYAGVPVDRVRLSEEVTHLVRNKKN